MSITPASENDLMAIHPILPQLVNRAIFADKAYCDKELNVQLLENANTFIFTPVKLVKGETQTVRQFKKAADDLLSTQFQESDSPLNRSLTGLCKKLIFKEHLKSELRKD